MTSENNGMFNMPVVPAYGGNGGGFGFDGNNGWWILILLILFGWNGNNGWGGNCGGGDIQRGFDQSALVNGVSGVKDAVTNGFANAETAASARQMASMNQMFGLQSSMQQCCCDQRAGIADLKYTIATEACADRNAVSMALRDVLEANNASTQKILDTMCQDKIDAKNEQIANLRQQLQMAQLAASQGAQTAQILANNEAQTAALERYLAPTPIPAYVVQNPNCCGQYGIGGCGCGGFAA